MSGLREWSGSRSGSGQIPGLDMSLIEGVKVYDMVMVGLAEGDGEFPMYAIMIV